MAGQDIKKRLAPGQPQQVNVGGDYIFLKFADRPVDIVITGGRSGGTRVTMEAGDKYRPGRFDAFEVQNTDPDNPAQVILTVGEGDYNRQIVQGELSVVPGVRAADGTFIEDTRWQLAADVDITDPVPVTLTKNQTLDSYSTSNALSGFAVMPKDNAVVLANGVPQIKRFDLESETEIVLVSGSRTKVFLGEYLVECFNSTIDKDGNTWLAGRRTSDNAPAFVQVDSYLNALGPVEIVPGFEHIRSTNKTGARLELGDRVFYFIILAAASNPSGGGQDGAVLVEKVGSQLITRLELPDSFNGYQTAHIESDNLVIHIADVSRNIDVYELENYEKLTDESGYFRRTNSAGGLTVDPTNREVWRASGSTTFYRSASLTWTRTAKGTFETCAGGYAFEPSETLTEASISARQTEKGVAIDGQVVRALLELWLGQFVADDYLDHVYRVEFDNANGRAPVTVSSGGTSFAGAKIADSFTSVVFPQTVRITIDNNLTTKA